MSYCTQVGFSPKMFLLYFNVMMYIFVLTIPTDIDPKIKLSMQCVISDFP